MKKRLSLRFFAMLLSLLLVVAGVSCAKEDADPVGDEQQGDAVENADDKTTDDKEDSQEVVEDTGVVYINAASGNDENGGNSAENAVATVEKAFALLEASAKDEKTLVVSGGLELDVLPENTKLIKITGDGAEGTQIVCSANGITLSGPIAFDNINLHITTANKFISTEGNELIMGENVTHDAENNVSDALNFHIGKYNSDGGREKFTFATDVGTVFVGSYYNDDFRKTAGADIVMNGGSCYRIMFGSDGWAGNHRGVFFTDDVNFTYNGGELNLIARHTDGKAPSFKGALQLVANHGNVFPEIPKMYADRGVFILSCEAVDGCYLEPVDAGVFKVYGGKTAVAVSEEERFVSAGGYLVTSPGTYSVSFTDEVYYNNDGETIEFTGDFSISPEYLYHTESDGKLFLGWTYEDGSLLDGTKDFKAGDILKANYADCKPEDFEMLEPAICYGDALDVKLETKMSESLKALDIKERGIVTVTKEKLGESTFTYNFSSATKYPLADTDTSVILSGLSEIEKSKTQYLVKGYIVYNDLFGTENILYTDEHSIIFRTLVTERLAEENIPEDEKLALETFVSEIRAELKKNFEQDEKVDVVGTADDPKTWIYQLKNSGLMIREVEIDTGSDKEPVEIVQVSDLHFNYLNDRDFEEANPSILATYAGRKWNANASSVPNAVRSLEFASTADQIVVTGDVLDYMSWGAIELMWEHIFTPYPGVMITLGNHEATRRCQDNPKTPDPTSLESRMEILQENWAHNIYYSSKVLDERVMLIQMDNGAASKFWDVQIEPFKADLELAREKGYTVLLFYHIPLCTRNPEETDIYPIRRNDSNNYNFMEEGIANPTVTDEATRTVYDLIVNNGDIIKGAFCGHKHSDYYTEIIAKTADGQDTVIPQYVLTGTPYDKGHALRITVK